jgi:hypothetical protein
VDGVVVGVGVVVVISAVAVDSDGGMKVEGSDCDRVVASKESTLGVVSGGDVGAHDDGEGATVVVDSSAAVGDTAVVLVVVGLAVVVLAVVVVVLDVLVVVGLVVVGTSTLCLLVVVDSGLGVLVITSGSAKGVVIACEISKISSSSSDSICEPGV